MLLLQLLVLLYAQKWLKVKKVKIKKKGKKLSKLKWWGDNLLDPVAVTNMALKTFFNSPLASFYAAGSL